MLSYWLRAARPVAMPTVSSPQRGGKALTPERIFGRINDWKVSRISILAASFARTAHVEV